jgi:hypothetical protein
MFDHSEKYLKPEYIKPFRELLRLPQNFFKHADRDPENIIEFYPSAAASMIWAASDRVDLKHLKEPASLRLNG